MKPPELWQKATQPELAKLGALHLRRYLLVRELQDVDRQLRAARDNVTALERTGALAAQLEAEGGPPKNGHAERAEGQSP